MKSTGCVQRVRRETKTMTFPIKKKKALTECTLWDLTSATTSVCFSLESGLDLGQEHDKEKGNMLLNGRRTIFPMRCGFHGVENIFKGILICYLHF